MFSAMAWMQKPEEPGSSWLETEATVVESEYTGTLFLDDCPRKKSEYRVVVQFEDQSGRSHTSEMTTCSRGGPEVGFDEYAIAYNPDDPQQIKKASDGFSTAMLLLGGAMVVGGLVMFVATTLRWRANRIVHGTMP